MRKIALFILLQLSVACGSESDSPLETESNLDSVVLTTGSSKWTNPRTIPVCIVNRAALGSELFNDLKDYVKSEYANKVGIGFTGWGDCTTADFSSKVIRVNFNLSHNWTNSSAVVAGGGLSMVGMTKSSCGTSCGKGTMRLDIGKTGNYPASSSQRSFIISRTRATAIHEFGHAVGLMHEHERSDATNCDKSDGSITEGTRYAYIGAYDANSIMNYCHSGSITTLSSGDIKGLQFLYPALTVSH